MGIRRFFSGPIIVVFLIMGRAAWSMPSAAARPTDPDEKDILAFVWEDDSQSGRAESKRSLLSLRIFGGYGQAKPGDLNEGLDGFYEVYKLYSALGYGTTTGGYTPLRDGYHAGADLVVEITPKLGIGLGAGYLRLTESSALTLSMDSVSLQLSSTPTVSAFPIRLGIFLSLPLGKKISLTAEAGATAYAELKLEEERRIQYFEEHWIAESLSAWRKAPLDNIGYHGSLGFEWRIFPNTGLFVEAVGEFARFGNFETAAILEKNDEGDVGKGEGRIYLAMYQFEGLRYSYFTVKESAPISESPNLTYKEPKIDLSRFSLQVGLRIRL